MRRAGVRRTAVAAAVLLLAACSGGGEPAAQPLPEASPPAETGSPTPDDVGTPSPDGGDAGGVEAPSTRTPQSPRSPSPTEEAPTRLEPRAPAVSVLGLAQQEHRGDRLRLGAVRERTSGYTSYDVTYRSRSVTPRGPESYTITGVLNVPRG
ncbi:MAG: hypothetical protein ACLGI3_00010, partial [Actinomycetes bacterium]